MAGLDAHTPVPTEVHWHQAGNTLEVAFEDGSRHTLAAELLRVRSPSAEVRGHGQPVLQTGKRHVRITGVEPVGHYAVRLVFDDGHDSGLYSWDYLYELGRTQDAVWQDYLAELAHAGASRDQ
ncbi:gamma-butyrobetaine hydroxylase-like domain-containing protein [Chitinibacteraceae bacterium HSL-7]